MGWLVFYSLKGDVMIGMNLEVEGLSFGVMVFEIGMIEKIGNDDEREGRW